MRAELIASKNIAYTGKAIWETSLKCEAHLPLPEGYRDHSLAGKEAIKEAFLELQNRIVKSGAFR